MPFRAIASGWRSVSPFPTKPWPSCSAAMMIMGPICRRSGFWGRATGAPARSGSTSPPKGGIAEAAHQAIERLKQEGYVDDRLFAQQWIDYRCRTAPRSRMAIMQELKQKGIARETILSAVATMDEAALALDCAQKKARQWRRYDGVQKEQRIAAFLQRKGFPYRCLPGKRPHACPPITGGLTFARHAIKSPRHRHGPCERMITQWNGRLCVIGGVYSPWFHP